MDDTSHQTTLILILLILLVFSGFFSATETAFSSLSRIRLKNMADGGSRRAARALALSDRYDELLSTILVGNNLVNIASTAIATVLFTRLLGEGVGPTVSTAVMTLAVLIFGEVGPKSLAKEAPESFAMFAAPAIRLLMILLKPVNFLFGLFKAGLVKLFRVGGRRSLTDSELLTIVEEAAREGGIDQEESTMLRNVIEFDDIEAIDIMTPRVSVEAVEIGSSPQEVAAVFRESGYSRLPVYEGTIDSVLGVIHEKNFYAQVWPQGEATLADILKPAVFVPPSMKISDLLRLLQNRQLQMAVIVDEFGGTEGVVTLEDVIEELVGEIWDEHDEVARESLERLPGGRIRADGSGDLDDLLGLLDLHPETDASTVNGWVSEMLDRIPRKGDSFDFGGCRFTVTDAEGNMARQVEVELRSEESDENEE